MYKKSVCSLDCFDLCSIIAEVKDDKIVSLSGDNNNPITKGFICSKGKEHLERLYDKDRIKSPLIKVNGEFKEISYENAIEIVSKRLMSAIKKGNDKILYNYDSGYGGVSKTIGEIFFSTIGGAITHSGSLCWAAGINALNYDFGSNKSNHPNDLINSEYIILWGRNVVDTNVHLTSFIKEAKKKNNAEIILIDPIKTNTAKISDTHLFIEPSTDALLALSMANYIVKNNLTDNKFIENYTKGFEKFKIHLEKYTVDYASKITKIEESKIVEIAQKIATKRTSIIIGYGVQRYKNGGNNIRAINSLLALTGNIGRKGSTVMYANKSISKLTSDYIDSFKKYSNVNLKYSKSKLGKFLLENEVDFMWIEKSNPVTQSPRSLEVIEGMKRVGFKVVVDMFLTDTAKEADIVFPTTSILEEEDFVYSSMFSPYLVYGEKVISPLYGILSEFELYKLIAKKIKNDKFPIIDKDEYFKKVFSPILNNKNLSLDELKKDIYIEDNVQIAWRNKKFLTPSGKFEFYSLGALNETGYALATYIEPYTVEYSYRLLTPHYVKSLHSQGFKNNRETPIIYISKKDFEKLKLNDGDIVRVYNKNGEVKYIAKESDNIIEGSVFTYEGRHLKDGCANVLTEDFISDMGEQAAYYDTFCKIDKLDK